MRELESIVVWGRSSERAQAFVERMRLELAVPLGIAKSVEEAVAA